MFGYVQSQDMRSSEKTDSLNQKEFIQGIATVYFQDILTYSIEFIHALTMHIFRKCQKQLVMEVKKMKVMEYTAYQFNFNNAVR